VIAVEDFKAKMHCRRWALSEIKLGFAHPLHLVSTEAFDNSQNCKSSFCDSFGEFVVERGGNSAIHTDLHCRLQRS
jgi:hypothetical protein